MFIWLSVAVYVWFDYYKVRDGFPDEYKNSAFWIFFSEHEKEKNYVFWFILKNIILIVAMAVFIIIGKNF